MNIENKKTALDDEAALYKHETDSMSEKEKLKTMSAAQKWQHFKQYYLLRVVFILAAVGLITAIMVTILKPKKKDVFYACVFDGCVGRDLVYSIRDDFEKSLALDSEKYKTTFDQDYLYTGPYCEAVSRYAMLTKAGTTSVALMPKSIFEMFARSSYFEKLEDVLTEEEMQMFRDELVFVAEVDQDGLEIDGSLAAYGIIIDGCSALSDNQCKEPVVLAFSLGKKEDNYAKDFMKFLFANE